MNLTPVIIIYSQHTGEGWYQDGVPTPKLTAPLERLSEMLVNVAGGFTYYPVRGCWVSEAGGYHLHEPGQKIECAIKDLSLPIIQKLRTFLAEQLGPDLEQKAIYFQVGSEAEIVNCKPQTERTETEHGTN